MSGRPPWPALVILNGRQYVAIAAQGEGAGFAKEGNCFTEIADPRGLAPCCSARAGRWRTRSTGSWTVPGLGWTSPRCGPFSGARPGRSAAGHPARPRGKS